MVLILLVYVLDKTGSLPVRVFPCKLYACLYSHCIVIVNVRLAHSFHSTQASGFMVNVYRSLEPFFGVPQRESLEAFRFSLVSPTHNSALAASVWNSL